MKKWEYQATNGSGDFDEGIIEATDFKDLCKKLLKKGLFPTTARTVSEATAYDVGQIYNLKKFKERLQTPPPEEEGPRTEFMSITIKKEEPDRPIDWTYPIFCILIIGLVIASIVMRT